MFPNVLSVGKANRKNINTVRKDVFIGIFLIIKKRNADLRPQAIGQIIILDGRLKVAES